MRILETEDIKYNLIKRIGSGATCSVYKGHRMEDSSKLFAIKIYSEQYQKYFEKEISIHEIISKSNLFIHLFKSGTGYLHYQEESIFNNEIYEISKVYYVIEELAENGELFNYVYELNKGFNDKISAKIFLQLLKSVRMLHKKGIIHGDIKPENALIGNDFDTKLIDFGFSQRCGKNNLINSPAGSDTYCAPEIRKAHLQGYDGFKSDIFSLGVLLFVIRVCKFPFQVSASFDKRYRLIMYRNYEEFWQEFEKENLSNDFKDLINHLICYDPSERFSIDEILEHPWIKNNINYINEKNKEINEENNCRNIIDEDVVEELKKRRNYMDKKMK